MYILIAGGGKVGSNLAFTLLKMGHEVTMLDNDRSRYARSGGEVRARRPLR